MRTPFLYIQNTNKSISKSRTGNPANQYSQALNYRMAAVGQGQTI